MDISGPLRTFLRTHVPPEPAAQTPLELLAQRLAFPEQLTSETPLFLRAGAPPILSGSFTHPMIGYLTLTSALRVVPRIGRWIRADAAAILRPQLDALQAAAEQLLLARATPAADFLWHCWLLILAKSRLDASVPESLLTGLWRRAWGAYARSSAPGPLHLSTAAISPETAASLDLQAIHAAYNAVVLSQEHERLDPIEKLARWHVQNPPSASIAAEPWALAAFVGLDETQTFAQRQLHDATVSAQPSTVTLALLADALLTQEEAAG